MNGLLYYKIADVRENVRRLGTDSSRYEPIVDNGIDGFGRDGLVVCMDERVWVEGWTSQHE